MGTKNDRNTSGVYRAEALRLIQSRRIWILCGILWLYLMIQGTEIYREVGADREIISGFWQQTVIQILRKKETVVLVASVSGIAHAASCMEDFQSRFYKFYLARMDVGAYIRGKIFGNFIGVTGMILAAGMLGILGIYLLYSPAETGTIEWKKELEAWQIIVNMLFTYCIGSMVLSSMAMYFSVAAESVYLAYLIPFVSFFVIHIMNQRFLKEIYYLNPYHWFLIEDYLSHEKLQMWGMLFLMYLGWNGLFADRVVRRLNGE